MPLKELGVEVFWGDVGDLESFEKAFAGCDAIIHLAAGTSGTEKDSQTATLQGTKNLLELCRRYQPRRLVYVSSCSVYGIAGLPKETLVTEQAELERFPDRRGSYSASKQEAEGYVTDYMKSGGVPTVILRPGTIYGPGADLYTPLLGFSAGHRYIVIGDGSFVLPFVYVDNVVDAIVECEHRDEAAGEVFNVVDPEPLTKRRYMDEVIRKLDPSAKVSYFSYHVLRAIVWAQELVFRGMRRPADSHSIPAGVFSEQREVRQQQDPDAARLDSSGSAAGGSPAPGQSRTSTGVTAWSALGPRLVIRAPRDRPLFKREPALYLTITIDTEEDNWGEYDRSSYSVANIARIPRLQDVFIRRGVRPTYLISYPVAMDPAAIDVLGSYRKNGLCEIGSHPHPWNTPPLDEPRTAFNSYISNLSPALQYQKIRTLHEAITRNFGAAPTSYRSGRWGFNEDVARNLIRLGYSVDTSISPATDWSEYEGIDYSGSSLEPFVYRMEDSAAERGGSLLEVPATIGFVQSGRRMANAAYWTIKRKLPAGIRFWLRSAGFECSITCVCHQKPMTLPT